MNIYKKISIQIIRFITIFTFATTMTQAWAITDAQANAELKNFATIMSAQLPMREEVGGFTTMKVYLESNRLLVFQLIDDIPANQWTNDMRSRARSVVINNYCTNPAMLQFKRINAKLKYMVFDRTWTYIHGTTVEPANCN